MRKKEAEKKLGEILIEFQNAFSKKIENLNPDELFEDIIREKDQEILRLKRLPENDEMLKRIEDLENIESSYFFRVTEKIKKNLFRIPLTRKLIFMLRRRL